MTARIEFTRAVRRERLQMSGLLCEATGPRYGYAEGHRCNAPLGNGVEFDHYIPFEFTRDSSLENCRAICSRCHKYATANDIRTIRKSDRVRDKNSGAMPRSRSRLSSSHLSRKFDGTVIDKRTGEAVKGRS